MRLCFERIRSAVRAGGEAARGRGRTVGAVTTASSGVPDHVDTR
jgi:hypothetical protein